VTDSNDPVPPITPPGDASTLGYARAWLRARVTKGEKCPCCNQRAQVYRRTINSGQARALIGMYRADRARGWIHANSLDSRSREEGKLRYWGLLEEERTRRPDGGRAGYWRITDLGEQFVLGRVRVPSHVHIYDDRLLKVDASKTISIYDALGKKFDYDKLMHGEE
jgi:hypothetical protein